MKTEVWSVSYEIDDPGGQDEHDEKNFLSLWLTESLAHAELTRLAHDFMTVNASAKHVMRVKQVAPTNTRSLTVEVREHSKPPFHIEKWGDFQSWHMRSVPVGGSVIDALSTVLDE